MTTDEACLEALREAADRLGESPTKAQYEELGLRPASATIMEQLGGWNAAKERAGLETFDRGATGDQPVQPKPGWVDIPDDLEWGRPHRPTALVLQEPGETNRAKGSSPGGNPAMALRVQGPTLRVCSL
ncbi:homing endonuclease associated repeat-containing protein [Natrinema limicola]|uniref:homing endonuclease associated repeat-containing protein n=1 Tax=Natrinema limicola TaxID=370323 RepID=UPI001F4C6F2A|nr:hypothetical protein [Natrinema limicola]